MRRLTAPTLAATALALAVACASSGVAPASIERDYLQAVRAAGAETVLVDAQSLTHGQVSSRIGAAGDRVMTPPLNRFLRDCFMAT